MSNDISFDVGEDKPNPTIEDEKYQDIKKGALDSIEKKQIEKQARAEAGLTDIPAPSESVPPELPKMLFLACSKIVGCERFELDKDEAKVFAKHLSIILGSMNSKIYSIMVIVIITISKVADCWGKAKRLLKGKKGDKIKSDQKTTFDETTETVIFGSGD